MTARFRLFFDMDGVLVDFDRHCRESGFTPEQVKKQVGAYHLMPAIAGALDGIRKVMSIAGQYGGEVWLATKPPTGIPHAYADKVRWVLENLPELKRRIILTHDKGLLGGEGDYLVDDRPHRANCKSFRGTLVHFNPSSFPEPTDRRVWARDWDELLRLLCEVMRSRHATPLPHGRCARVGAPCECAPEAMVGCVSWVSRGDEPSLDDINAARGLLRLGPLQEHIASTERAIAAAYGPAAASHDSLAPFERAITQAGVDAVMGTGYVVDHTLPDHPV